jgi:hypothetical protein
MVVLEQVETKLRCYNGLRIRETICELVDNPSKADLVDSRHAPEKHHHLIHQVQSI